MFTFSIRNAVIIALGQVWIIVGGVLAAGVTHKIFTESAPGAEIPSGLSFIANAGVTLQLIPLSWIVVALLIRQNPRVPDQIKSWVFLSGLALAGILLIVMIKVTLVSLLGAMGTEAVSE